MGNYSLNPFITNPFMTQSAHLPPLLTSKPTVSHSQALHLIFLPNCYFSQLNLKCHQVIRPNMRPVPMTVQNNTTWLTLLNAYSIINHIKSIIFANGSHQDA